MPIDESRDTEEVRRSSVAKILKATESKQKMELDEVFKLYSRYVSSRSPTSFLTSWKL